MRVMAGAATLGDFVSAIGIREQEAAIVAELKAGSEEAYAWLIGEFHQPIYGMIYAGSIPESVSRNETLQWRVDAEDLDLPHRVA
jgi:hypothetical protein